MSKKAKAGGKPKPPKIRKTEEAVIDCQYTFNTKERDEIARDMAAKMSTHAALEEQLKCIAADYKSRMKMLEAEIEDRHGKFTNGYEFRATKVTVHFNKGARGDKPVNRKGWKLIIRNDTKTIVREEPMTPSDMHAELFEKKAIEEESVKAKEKKNGDKPLNEIELPEPGETTSTAATA